MAIKKIITTENGNEVSYFRIASINQNYINPTHVLEVYIYGYKSEDYRQTEKIKADRDFQTVLSFKHYILPLSSEDDSSMSGVYKRIKEEIPEFENAEDLL